MTKVQLSALFIAEDVIRVSNEVRKTDTRIWLFLKSVGEIMKNGKLSFTPAVMAKIFVVHVATRLLLTLYIAPRHLSVPERPQTRCQ